MACGGGDEGDRVETELFFFPFFLIKAPILKEMEQLAEDNCEISKLPVVGRWSSSAYLWLTLSSQTIAWFL